MRIGRVIAGLGACALLAGGLSAPDAHGHCAGPPKGPPGLSPPPLAPPGTTPRTGPHRRPPATTPRQPGPTTPGTEASPPWQSWWRVNEPLVRVRANSREGATTIDTPLFRAGGSLPGNVSDEGRATRRAVETEILPALREIVQRKKEDPEVLASAVLALAKVAQTEEDVRLIMAVGKSPGGAPMVLESALLAYGLLRRTDPATRFSAAVLDPIREGLLLVSDDRRFHLRARCFATLALGLLADQPTEEDPVGGASRRIVRALWIRVRDSDEADEERDVALLAALSIHPPASISDEIKDGLRGLLATGRLGRMLRSPVTQAYAATALGRLGCVEHAGALAASAGLRTFSREVRRAAALSVAALADRLSPEIRATAARTCVAAVDGADAGTIGILLLAAARLLRVDFAAGSGLVEETARVSDALVRTVEKGRRESKGIAAVALATAVRVAPGTDDLPELSALRARTMALLLQNAIDGDERDHDRAAYCLALGLAGDPRAERTLHGVASGHTAPDAVRAHACAGLGLLGRVSPDALALLRQAGQKGGDDPLAPHAVRALGLLRDAASAPMLLARIEGGGPDVLLARAALALGDIRDASVAPRLAALARSKTASNTSRWVACCAMGLLGDPEPEPSLERLARDADFLTPTDALAEATWLL